MSCNFFSGTVLTVHSPRAITALSYNKDRLGYDRSVFFPVLSFKNKVNAEGDIYDTRYPQDVVITSAPMLMNFDSFPTNQKPDEFVRIYGSVLDDGFPDKINSQIAFRSSDSYAMEPATEWSSINANSYNATTNYEIFNLINSYRSVQSTDFSSLDIEYIVSGITINADDFNSIGEVGYIELKDGVSGLSSFSNMTGRYLAADMVSTAAGPVMEMVVLHELEIANGRTDIKTVRAPYKNLIHFDKAGKEQLVVWDITDWDTDSDTQQNRIDNMRAIGFKVLDGTNGKIKVDIRKLRLYSTARPGVGGANSGVPFPLSSPAKYIQYQLTMSRTDVFSNLYLSGIQFSTNVRKTVLPGSLMRHNKCVNLGVVDYPERSGLRIVY